MKNCKNIISAAVITGMLASNTVYANQTDTWEGKTIPEQLSNAAENMNIVFITTDQEHYFSKFPEGSNYKARELLKEMGTTFEKHYICSNVSTSSRSVIYTGTHITNTKMIDNTNFMWQNSLSPDIRTTGDIMREAGYYTALKGKWHLINFDFDPKYKNYAGPALQMQDELEQYGFSDWNADGDYWGQPQEGYKIDGVVTADTVSWLRTTGAKTNSAGKPFFLAVNLVNPHDIMYYNPRLEAGAVGASTTFVSAGRPDNKVYEKTYKTPVPSTWNEPLNATGRVKTHSEYMQMWSKAIGFGMNSTQDWKSFQDYYFNCLQDSDNSLMNIMDELKNLNMLDNTIIVFTSDHGDMQGAHGLSSKGGFMYEYNIHVPMIIYHPDYEGGKSVSAVTSHLDLATTFVAMTNLSSERKAQLTKGLAGKSMLDLMDGSSAKIRDGALFAFEMPSLNGKDFGPVTDSKGKKTGLNLDETKRGVVRGITTERYKFARYFSPVNFNTPTTLEQLYANNDVELFDLQNDPNELVNLAADPKTNGKLIMEMNTLLNKLIEEEIGVDDGAEVKAVHKIINGAFGIK